MRLRPPHLLFGIALAGGAAAVVAQIDNGNAGVAPIDSSGSFEVSGVQVDVTGKTAEAARTAGWRLAQRKGWVALSNRLGAGGGLVSDGTLDALVSGIVIEDEQIGPTRYIARLGVLFSRARAGPILGVAGESSRSPPLLVVPLLWSGGAGQVFEQSSEWQKAWARFRTGNSAIDYVRPAGTGPDALLLNAGQAGRPDRVWWKSILDQYGASDVVTPTVRLYRQWPGGPIIGVFQARRGPDNRLLTQFSLRVGNGDGLPLLLDAGVKRIDEAYQAALRSGLMGVDPGLVYHPDPADDAVAIDPNDPTLNLTDLTATTPGVGGSVSLQFDTPNAAAVTSTESTVRSIMGVRSAVTTSLALGGVSVMRVAYDSDPALLRTALESRGFVVQGSGTTLRVRRGAAPSLVLPPLPPDNATAG